MASGEKPKCNGCFRDDRMIWTELIPARVEEREIRSQSSLHPVAVHSRLVKAGVRFACQCGVQSEVEAPEGWRPDEE